MDKDKGFFCSELVMKALKSCGLLAPTTEACSNFLPSAFTSKEDKIKLVPGAQFLREQFIISDWITNDDT